MKRVNKKQINNKGNKKIARENIKGKKRKRREKDTL